MKKTAKQLAEELGVSATTVSLAFRGSKSISKATRDRVLAAAKAAGMEIPEPAAEEKICNTAGLRYDLLGLYRKDSILPIS